MRDASGTSAFLILATALLLLPARPVAAQQVVKVEKIRPAPAVTGEAALAAAAVARSAPQFQDVTESAGLFAFHMGMGLSWGDYDNNGYPDLFVSGYHRHPDLLFQNKTDGTFRRADTLAGVNAGGAAGFGCAFGDYDNDGLLDLYVVNVNGQQDFLWKNNGDGTFQQVAASVGMSDAQNNFGAVWGDYNGDGWLDLFVVGGSQHILYHNLGGGSFVDVAAKAGLSETSCLGYGAAWGDYDNDGDLDLYVTRSVNDSLYRNNGNGTFSNVAAEVGIVESANSMGVAWSDYDNDGDLDLYVANYGKQNDALWKNNGDDAVPRFSNVAEKVGIQDNLDGRGASWGDYDNDGDIDIAVANDGGKPHLVYRNNGNGAVPEFTNVTFESGARGGAWGIGVAWADYDNDGNLDLYIGTQVTHVDFLYKNIDTGTYNWIKVNPLTAGPFKDTKKDTPVFRLAIGTWVELDLDGGGDFTKGRGRYAAGIVGGGDGLANSAVPIHFGVGGAKTVDIRVTYPTGKVIRMTKVQVKQTMTLKDR